MSKKSVTTASFNVTVELPPGTNLKEMQMFIRESLLIGAAHSANKKMEQLKADPIRVALAGKTTTYG